MTHLRQVTSFHHHKMTRCGIDGLLERSLDGICTRWKAPLSHGTHLSATFCE
jgi:hypothetical protein